MHDLLQREVAAHVGLSPQGAVPTRMTPPIFPASGISTSARRTGPATGTNATTCTPGVWNLARMLEAVDDIPLNIGFTGKGNTSRPEGLLDQILLGAAPAPEPVLSTAPVSPL